MTDTQTVSRKPFHPLLVALFAGLASLILNIPFFWVLQAPLSDPQYTFSTEIPIKELFDEGALWSVALFSASSVFLTLYGTRRCSNGFRSRHGRLALQMGAAFPFAASTLSPFLIADEFRWTESQFRDVYQSIFVLIAICFVIWVLISWMWQDPIVAERGCRHGMNFAIVALLFSIPAHAIATYPKAWLSGISTMMAIYSSVQALLILTIGKMWTPIRPLAEPASGMHAAAAHTAMRDSALFAGGAFLLLVISYAIYPLVYWDRFTVALLGQLGFCVFASCATARGIAGLLLRESRPFWLFGAYALLVELIVIAAWQLILPGFV